MLSPPLGQRGAHPYLQRPSLGGLAVKGLTDVMCTWPSSSPHQEALARRSWQSSQVAGVVQDSLPRSAHPDPQGLPLPTHVSPGQEGDQVLPLQHLLLVLKVSEAS